MSNVTGEVEKEDGVLVVKRIHVAYQLKASPDHQDTIDRVHAMHHDKCPVYKSICNCIAITTSLDLQT